MTTDILTTIEQAPAEHCWAEVETAVAAGTFEPLAACQVLEVVRTPDGQDEYALLQLAPASQGRDSWGGWSAARRVAVAARCSDAERYLFCGCPATIERRFDAAVAGEKTIVRLEGLAASVRRQVDLAVYGRFARTRQDWSAGGTGDAAERVDGLECLFNPDGRSNCAAIPITVRLTDGAEQLIHVFTHDDDPDARPWTVSRVLRYLAWFYFFRHPWLDIDELLRVTQDSSLHEAAGRDYLRAAQPLEWALRGRVESFAAEGFSAVDALTRLLRSTGLHWHIEPVGSAGRLRSEVRLWTEHQGPARSFDLANAAPLDHLAAAVKACVAAAHLRRQLSGGVQQTVVLGGVKQHEVTIELVPGWMPVPEIDAVALSQREAAKQLALLPEDIDTMGPDAAQNPWFQAYHRKGTDFAAHQDIGRKWVLNEHGGYSGSLYNRYTPFNDYQPFPFKTVIQETVAHPDGWMVRPRRLLDPITRSAEGQPLALAVDVSFDGGATWSAHTGALRVLADECGVVLDADNLCEITPPGVAARTSNFWYGLIDQQAHVRVTAVIEGDERVTARTGQPDAGAMASGTLIQAESLLPYRRGDGATNVLREAHLTGQDVDSSPAASVLAEQKLDPGRPFGFDVILPGVRLDVILGQRVWGLAWPDTRLYRHALSEPLPAIRRIEYACGDSQVTRAKGE